MLKEKEIAEIYLFGRYKGMTKLLPIITKCYLNFE